MSTLQLLAADGNQLSAYLVKPEGTPRGAVVVVQEIFGVNSHIRASPSSTPRGATSPSPRPCSTACRRAWTSATTPPACRPASS